MRLLVMGGTEFISLHLLQSLLRRGHEVTVFKRGRRQERLPAGIRAVTGDRKDHAGLRERLRGERFDGECHAVHTTHKLRLELGIRPRYTLPSGLAQTWKWYQPEGLVERPIDTGFEDRLFDQIGA